MLLRITCFLNLFTKIGRIFFLIQYPLYLCSVIIPTSFALYMSVSMDMPNCIWINMSSCNDISFLDMPISLINSEVGISISLTKTLHNFSLSLSCSSWAKFNNRYPNSYKAVNRCLSAVAFLLTMIKRSRFIYKST